MSCKMVLITIILIIATIAISCSVNPLTDDFKKFEKGGDFVDYFPLSVGNVWRYKVTEFEGNQVFTDSTCVTEITTIEGKTCYPLKEAYFPYDVYCYKDTVGSLIKLYKYDLSSPATSSWHEYLIVHKQLPGGDYVGTIIWFWYYNSGSPYFVNNYFYQYPANETINAPAGKYTNCIKVNRRVLVYGGSFDLYYWYAPGIGLVAFSSSSYKLELIGYELH